MEQYDCNHVFLRVSDYSSSFCSLYIYLIFSLMLLGNHCSLYFVYATLFTYFLALLLLYCYAQEDTSSLKSLDVNVDDKDSLIAELRKQNEQLQKENAKLKQLYTTCVWLVVRALNSHNVSIRHSVRRD